jgi:hypothetical protein
MEKLSLSEGLQMDSDVVGFNSSIDIANHFLQQQETLTQVAMNITDL